MLLQLEMLCSWCFQEQHEFVRAVSDHPTRDPSLLAFKKGELIKVVNKDQYIQKGASFIFDHKCCFFLRFP
jgi:Variant SH3 domain